MMSDNISFLELTEEYIDQITELDSICFEDNWSRALFENELLSKNSYCVIALLNNNIVAYCTISTVLDEADITKLAVHPDFRRLGIGARLIDIIFEYCTQNGICTVNLELRESNSSALALYSGKGFKIVGERNKYYNNSENAVLMTKFLKEV